MATTRFLFSLSLMLGLTLFGYAQNAERTRAFASYHRYYEEGLKENQGEKARAILEQRAYYANYSHRGYAVNHSRLPSILAEWLDDGRFPDLIQKEKDVLKQPRERTRAITGIAGEAYARIRIVAEAFRRNRMNVHTDSVVFLKCLKAILYYGNVEASLPNIQERFFASCFGIPNEAANIYFCFLKQMDAVESGQDTSSRMKAVCDMLKVMGLQVFTTPPRPDSTEKNVVQVDRFRGNGGWVGANGISYRALLPVAVMYRSTRMLDVISTVAHGCLSQVSQNTYNQAFWVEGFTADGAAWGHGKQCLIWGYPIQGTTAAVNILAQLKKTPWAHDFTQTNVETLLNFCRGSNWFYYKGYTLPFLSRYTAQYRSKPVEIPTMSMVRPILTHFSNYFTAEQVAELKRFSEEAKSKEMDIKMNGYPAGDYNGTRWFFNNDKLIKKNSNYHIFVNMASVRCQGLEGATFADNYNFFATDGMTLFQRRGNEYQEAVGAWDFTSTPGVTAREGMNRLTPQTNWGGFCSKYNFAAGATRGGENAVAGYIFEKMNTHQKQDPKFVDKVNPMLYGVKAYKSYFMLGDYVVALGAGVTNLSPEQAGTIRTTIDQTLYESELQTYQKGKPYPLGGGDVHPLVVKNHPLWVVQKGKFAYAVLPKYTRQAYFTFGTKKTQWMEINPSNKGNNELPDSASILRLWIDHSQTPKDDTYGYVVYAGNDIPPNKLPFEVLRNDTMIQAVRSMNDQVLEAVFYSSNAELKKPGWNVSVSDPCVVLLEKIDHGEVKISLTDPLMNARCTAIELTLNGKKTIVPMPQGELLGKPVTVEVQ